MARGQDKTKRKRRSMTDAEKAARKDARTKKQQKATGQKTMDAFLSGAAEPADEVSSTQLYRPDHCPRRRALRWILEATTRAMLLQVLVLRVEASAPLTCCHRVIVSS